MVPFFRILAFIEGLSFLVILFVTMPLKYIWEIKEPNVAVGMAHGGLVILYVLIAVAIYFKFKWKLATLSWVLLASLLPFGTFVADRKILKKMVNHQPE